MVNNLLLSSAVRGDRTALCVVKSANAFNQSDVTSTVTRPRAFASIANSSSERAFRTTPESAREKQWINLSACLLVLKNCRLFSIRRKSQSIMLLEDAARNHVERNIASLRQHDVPLNKLSTSIWPICKDFGTRLLHAKQIPIFAWLINGSYSRVCIVHSFPSSMFLYSCHLVVRSLACPDHRLLNTLATHILRLFNAHILTLTNGQSRIVFYQFIQ